MTKTPVLLVVDAQQGFRDADYWGLSANPDVYTNIELLVAEHRSMNWPVVIVKHNSQNPDSPLNRSGSGNDLEPFLEGPRDLVIQKTVNSAFYGTPDLHYWLTKMNYRKLVICGITTNFCCETTARMAGNLGYEVEFIIDATTAFDKVGPTGERISGQDLMKATATNLHGEFGNVLTTKDYLAKLTK